MSGNGKSQDILHAVYHRYSHIILHAAICDPAVYLSVIKCFCVDKFCYLSTLLSLTIYHANTNILEITAYSRLYVRQ